MSFIKRTFGFINNHPLAKKNLFEAYWRFAKWQIISRLSSNLIEVPFIEHTKVVAKKGMTGITGSIYTGLHEFEDMSFLLHLLKQGDVFFDVGANIGSYTILAAGIKSAHTISFEPIYSTYEILSKNIEINGLNDLVHCENKGVGGKDDVLLFTNEQDTTNHVITENELQNNLTEVKIVKLDNYYPNFKPILIKINVEGFETEVLNGSEQILNDPNLKAIIIELNGSGERYGYNEENIHEKLINLGFHPHQYLPFERKLTLKLGYGNLNTIYIRDISFVKDRITNSPKIKMLNCFV